MGFVKRKTLIILAILGFIFIGLSVTAVIVWRKIKDDRINKPGILFSEAIELFKKGELKRSEVFLKEALHVQPNNKDMHWVIAQVYRGLKNTNNAQTHALKAWKLGLKDKQTLYFLVQGCGLDTLKAKIKYGRDLIKEIPEEDTRLDLQGDMHIALSEFKEGLDIFQGLYKQKATPELTSKIAHALTVLKRNEDAMTILRDAMKKNLLGEQSYTLLSSMIFIDKPNQKEIAKLFTHAKANGLYKENLAYHDALLKTITGQLVEANKILTANILNDDKKVHKSSHLSRLLLGFNAFTANDIKTLESLIEWSAGDGGDLEGERLLYKSLIAANKKESPAKLKKSFDIIRKLLPKNFVIELLYARLETTTGAPLKALEFHKGIKNPLYHIWPVMVLDRVTALQSSDRQKEALSYLMSYHNKRKSFTLQTAIKQRDLFIQLKHLEAAQEVQKFLEKTYPKSVAIKVQGALLKLQNGNIEDAEKALKGLTTNNKNNPKFTNLYASFLVHQNKFKESLTFLSEKEITSDNENLKASAHRGLKEYGDAEAVYLKAIKELPSEKIFQSYGSFLIQQNRAKEARVQFNKAHSLYPRATWPLISLAALDFHEGKFHEALDKAQHAKDINNSPLLTGPLLAEIHYRLRDLKSSLKEAEAVLRLKPQHHSATMLKGMCLLLLNQKYHALQ
ncbi:MAG: tetratricopeptide repeat protein, partial [Lentisphaeraceae bacterium]|nr:tetratricopeptide repeat protein [Lentisphaeraceae bacterium]